MAWIYLAESADSAWPWHPGCDQSPTVKTTDMLRQFYYPECPQETFRSRPSGMTSRRYERKTFLQSTPSTEVSHARTSALLVLERAWRASEADLCLNSLDSLASADLDSFSWKTSQLSLFGGLTAFSWSSMRSGMMRDGQLYQPQKWEPHTSENESGFLPTSTATPYGSNQSPSGGAAVRPSLETLAKGGGLPTPVARDWKGQGMSKERRETRKPDNLCSMAKEHNGTARLHPQFVEWMMGYPIEWTALEAWATQWFRSKRGRRSRGSSGSQAGDGKKT
jgi:hypothetical protein